MTIISTSLSQNKSKATELLPLDESFDIISRDLFLGRTKCWFLGINGMCQLDLLQDIFSNLQDPYFTQNKKIIDISDYITSKISYAQVSLSDNWEAILLALVSGPSILFFEGFSSALILDTRNYPARGISEPDNERVISGSKDGFVETLLFNANLIRRRIRNPGLTFSLCSIGTDSHTDVAIAYVKGFVDDKLRKKVRETLSSLQISALTMGAKTLEELLVPKSWLHPLPSIFLTERPDVACSYLLEGNLLILIDNSPAVLVLPSTIFQFTQSPEDYYKNSVIGSYSRILRLFCIIVSLFLLPTFLLIGSAFPDFSNKISLFPTETLAHGKLFFYIMFAEFSFDLFQYSAAHSPSPYSGSLSIVGGLILSDVAITLNWLSLEVIFYAAATMLATLTLSSIAFAEGIRLYRIFLLLSTGFFGIYGFCIGCILILCSILTTPTFAGKSYFWPIYPWNQKAFQTLILRRPTNKEQPGNIWKRTKNTP